MPAEILESAGIAWPSPEMYHHPLPRESPQMKSNIHHFGEAPNHAAHHTHRKMSSMGNLQLPMMNGGQHFNGPVRHLQEYNTIDPSTRSTSAYSTLSASAGPIISPTFNGPAPQHHANVQGNGMRDGQYQFRLPSDQLAQIINALGALKQEPQSQHATNMPPPPLPAHVTHFKNGIDGAPGGQFVPLAHKNRRSETDQHAINAFDRRAASNSGYSDVSMHANCNAFPHCITEDPNGCLVHDSNVAPSSVVKSRKEGSSPTKRKLSLSAGSKNADHTEKRARTSSRLLQRDTRRSSGGKHSSSSAVAADDDGAEGHDDEFASQSSQGGPADVVVAGPDVE